VDLSNRPLLDSLDWNWIDADREDGTTKVQKKAQRHNIEANVSTGIMALFVTHLSFRWTVPLKVLTSEYQGGACIIAPTR
jgi:hypothetical protein